MAEGDAPPDKTSSGGGGAWGGGFAADLPFEILKMASMWRFLPRWLFAFAGCLLGTGTELRADEAIPFARVAPLFKKHCHCCHGLEQAKGKLRIDKLNPDFVKGNDLDHWRDVLEPTFRYITDESCS